MRRGSTLVEMMIAVALVGIAGAGLGFLARQAELSGAAELQHERATVLLHAHAAAAARGEALPEPVARRLALGLPDAALVQRHEGGLLTLELTWRDAMGGPGHQALAVFVPDGPR